jgi:dTDP-4-amino-4,6-dideoxygalactose transaminase
VKTRVKLVDLEAQHAELMGGIERAMERVVSSSQFILGPEVDRFEQAAASFLGVEHAVGVSSGTDALLVALMALGIGPDDDVITTPFTFFATIEVVLRLGARPRFVDVDPGTMHLDVSRVEAALTSRTRAILPVHLYGTPMDVDALARVADRHGVPIVEDAAQAFGSQSNERAVGTRGIAGCFSFFPTKVLGALGDAGLIATNDGDLAARSRALRQHGAVKRGEHVAVGGNFRLDALQAAVLGAKLPLVPEWIARRRALGDAYDAALDGLSGLVPVARGEGWNGAVYTLRVRDGRRDALKSHLGAQGIETAIYYERPAHLQPVLGAPMDSLRESERAAAEVLSLPVHQHLASADQETVIEAIKDFYRGPAAPGAGPW